VPAHVFEQFGPSEHIVPAGPHPGRDFRILRPMSRTKMSLRRSLVAIAFVACAYALLMFSVVEVPPIYSAGITVSVMLVGFAVVAWACLLDDVT
jgi:hypothetical protein